MIDYTSNIEIILGINLIIMTGILINSIYIGFFEKFKNMKYISRMYFLEILIYIGFILTKDKFISIYKYLIFIYVLAKIVYFYILKNKLKLKKIKFIIISICNISSLIFIIMNLKLYLLTNIILNLIIFKITIVDKMKSKCFNLDYKLQKLQKIDKSINYINNKIGKEKIIQNEHKENICKVEKNIREAIEESDMPVIILNENNDVIFYNKYLWKNKNMNLNKINILDYLNENFENGDECIRIIKDTEINEYISINLFSKEEKVYRFICTKEVKEEKSVKICIFNDITQSTLIQKQIKDSEDKYRKLMDLLIDGVIIHDMNNIEYINDSAVGIFDIDINLENICMDEIKNKIDKSHIKKFNESLNLVMKGKMKKIVNKFKTFKGTYIEIITTKIEAMDAQVLLSIIVDINETELALKQLEENNKTYQALAQNLPDGIVLIDKNNNKYIYQNRSMIRILKQVKVDSINKFINDYTSNNYYGQTKRYEFNKDKSSYVGITIIDMKEENQLLAIIRLLENEERVLEAIKELDLVNAQHHVKNEFLINTSKCLKKPIENISNVNTSLELNKSKYNSKHIDKYTKLVRQNCYRLQRLINNMNEVVDVENGIYSTNFVYCDIVKFTEDIVESINRHLYDEQVNIKFKSNLEYSILKIDRDKMERIILNLISNAIKFSEVGSPIEVRIKKDMEYIKISVKDNGVGIPKDRLKFIFTKFGQVDKTLSRNTEGSGVGLTLVKAFAKLHGGDVNVESEEGKGSEFTITLKKCNKVNDMSLVEANKHDESIYEKINVEFADIYF